MADNNVINSNNIEYVKHPLIKKNSIEFRLYQKNIVNLSKNKNTMVILPTALGKTVIAALICADIMYNYKKLKILIMAPTRPLVLQHMSSFSSFLQILNEQKIMMTGKTSPILRKSIWKNEFIKLIFATPEIVKNDILKDRINLKEFGLIVFDESHRAVKDYAYTFIAKKYLESVQNPLILGMTASPGSDNEKIEQICENLNIEHIEYRNEEDIDVKQYINPIYLQWKWLDLPDIHVTISKSLKSMLNEKLRWLSSRGLLRKKNIDYIFKKDLIELGDILKQNLKFSNPQNQGSLFYAILTQSAALSLMYCIELIESQGSFSLNTFIKRMEDSDGKSHSMLLKDPRMTEIRKKLSQNNIDHPKIEYIVDLLKNNTIYHKKEALDNSPNNSIILNQQSKVLIFTHYRDTAKHIVDILGKNDIKSFRFVGQASREDDIGMKQDEQSSILNSFRKGEFNVLVATSIAEEGLDIPEVDLVIFYEPISSEIRYIQRKGRTGRKSKGSVVILVTKDTVDTRILYASKRKVEKMKMLLNTIKTKLEPIDRQILKPDPYTENELNQLYLMIKKQKVLDNSKTMLNEEENNIKERLISSSFSFSQSNKKIVTKNKILSIENNDDSKFLKRQIDKISRFIYRDLVKTYSSRSSYPKLNRDYFHENINIDPDIVDESLKQLEKKKLIKFTNGDVIDLCSHCISNETDKKNKFNDFNSKNKKNGCYNICVEKIISGKAIVIVNGKWHATLNHYDYDGPRNLLKRGSEFNAASELYYNTEGIFCVRIKEVLLN